MKASPPASLFNYQAYPPVQIYHRQFLAPADAPKSRPFSHEVRFLHMQPPDQSLKYLHRTYTLCMISLTRLESNTIFSNARGTLCIKWRLKVAKRSIYYAPLLRSVAALPVRCYLPIGVPFWLSLIIFYRTIYSYPNTLGDPIEDVPSDRQFVCMACTRRNMAPILRRQNRAIPYGKGGVGR